MLAVLFPSTAYIGAGSSSFLLNAFVYLKYNTLLSPSPLPIPLPGRVMVSKMSRELIATDKNPYGGI